MFPNNIDEIRKQRHEEWLQQQAEEKRERLKKLSDNFESLLQELYDELIEFDNNFDEFIRGDYLASFLDKISGWQAKLKTINGIHLAMMALERDEDVKQLIAQALVPCNDCMKSIFTDAGQLPKVFRPHIKGLIRSLKAFFEPDINDAAANQLAILPNANNAVVATSNSKTRTQVDALFSKTIKDAINECSNFDDLLQFLSNDLCNLIESLTYSGVLPLRDCKANKYLSKKIIGELIKYLISKPEIIRPILASAIQKFSEPYEEIREICIKGISYSKATKQPPAKSWWVNTMD